VPRQGRRTGSLVPIAEQLGLQLRNSHRLLATFIELGSLAPGLIGVAAPIIGRDSRAATALSVSGPAERLTEKRSGM
jgi:DNA-binding IclR family transcriptional regulator